jgi:hypothetical protein
VADEQPQGDVLGVDYLENQINKLNGSAQQNGVVDRVKGVCMDVEKNNGQELVEEYPEHFDLVSVARFLHRYRPYHSCLSVRATPLHTIQSVSLTHCTCSSSATTLTLTLTGH